MTPVANALALLLARMRALDERVEHWARIEEQRGMLALQEPTGARPNGHLVIRAYR